MSRARMFPTKSRLQVAIMLEALLHSYAHHEGCRGLAVLKGDDQAAQLFTYISTLILFRLSHLIRPCLFEPSAMSYHHTDRLRVAGLSVYLSNVRGWRRRWPRLLEPERSK